MKRDVYRAIMIAAAQGKGVHLTCAECFDLSLDDAIATRAGNSLTETEHNAYVLEGDTFWSRQKAFQTGEAANLSGWAKDDPARPLTPTQPERGQSNDA